MHNTTAFRYCTISKLIKCTDFYLHNTAHTHTHSQFTLPHSLKAEVNDTKKMILAFNLAHKKTHSTIPPGGMIFHMPICTNE